MQKISLALAIAGLTTSLGAYAAMPANSDQGQVVTPGINFTVAGLYLRPTDNNLVYGKLVSSQASGFAFSNLTNRPDYKLSYMLGMGYVFPGTNNDVQLNWTHFDSTKTDSVTAGAGQVLVLSQDISIENEYSRIVSTNKFKYNAVDLNAGQYKALSDHLVVRLSGGLRYVDLKNDSTAVGNNFLGGQSTSVTNSKFVGIGPRIALDGTYQIPQGNERFGITAGAGVSALIGNAQGKTVFTGLNGVGVVTTNSFDAGKSGRIVPGIDAKLGFNYSHLFSDTNIMTVELGYQMSHYINVLEKPSIGPTDASEYVVNNSSVGFDGPYLSLNWKI